jgi:hypothetical protein
VHAAAVYYVTSGNTVSKKKEKKFTGLMDHEIFKRFC